MKHMRTGLVVALFFTAVFVWGGLKVTSQEQKENGDDSKYGKYVLTDVLYKEIGHYTGTSLVARDGRLQGNVSMCYHCLTKPISFDMTHSHDFEETLCFIGGNPLNITDFEAVIECTIDGEKHILTKPSCVTIPKGLPHCPISVRDVSPEKPIVFLEISLSSSYGTPKEVKP